MSRLAAADIVPSSVVGQRPAAELKSRAKGFVGDWTGEIKVEHDFPEGARKGEKAIRRAAFVCLLVCGAALPLTSFGQVPGSKAPVFNDRTKAEYLTKYAPQVWLHSRESYWPSSVEWSFHFLTRHWLERSKSWWLITKDPLKEPSSVLPYFHGADPKRQWTRFPLSLSLGEVPAYAFWHQVDNDTADLLYYFYYPYNRGKEVVDTIFGSHVGDWEHVTVRLTRRQEGLGPSALEPSKDPKQNSFCLAYHSHQATYPWVQVPKVKDTEHPIVYSALGSHGSYLTAGKHKYDQVRVVVKIEDLVDLTDNGTPWDTWKKLECFDYDAKRGLGPKAAWPKWLEKDTGDRKVGNEDPASGPVTSWGNPAQGQVFGAHGWTRAPSGLPTSPTCGRRSWIDAPRSRSARVPLAACQPVCLHAGSYNRISAGNGQIRGNASLGAVRLPGSSHGRGLLPEIPSLNWPFASLTDTCPQFTLFDCTLTTSLPKGL